MISLWNRLGVRILTGWGIVCALPLLILWQYLPKDAIVINLINSWVASSLGLILNLILLDRFTRLPGRDSMLVVLPTYFTVLSIFASGFLILRIPYSVYYLGISLPLGLIFSFLSQFFLKISSKTVLAYIPVGRYQDLLMIPDIQWVDLSNKPKLLASKITFSAVIVDLSDDSLYGQWERYLGQVTIQGIPVYSVLQAKESLTGRLPIRHLYENNLGSLLPPKEYIAVKRLLDNLFIIISLPIIVMLMAVIAIAIYLEDGKKSSVLFTQNRVGQGGKVFKMYKFRSMQADAPEQNKLMTQANDYRVTRVGRVIRKWRMDELPQFWNVLKGEMSLIGPRPELPTEVARLDKEIPFYIYRQIVKPGISGWAQVMQGDGHVENIQTKLEYDFYYIKNFSFTLDFLIVIKTIQTMLTGFGAR